MRNILDGCCTSRFQFTAVANSVPACGCYMAPDVVPRPDNLIVLPDLMAVCHVWLFCRSLSTPLDR